MSEPKLPPSFKSLLPFTRRADELDRDTTRDETKLIAYYCRQYAMELGIKLREKDNSNEATNYLLALMDRLEQDKTNLGELALDDGKDICECFAMEVFSKADDEDREGHADKHTARTFYAASIFLEIMNQFGDVDPDIVEKLKYSKYKAATILKALKEGQVPTPGGPTGLTTSVCDVGGGIAAAIKPTEFTVSTGSSGKDDSLSSSQGYADAGQSTGDRFSSSGFSNPANDAPASSSDPNNYGTPSTYQFTPPTEVEPPVVHNDFPTSSYQQPAMNDDSSFPSMTTSVGIIGPDFSSGSDGQQNSYLSDAQTQPSSSAPLPSSYSVHSTVHNAPTAPMIPPPILNIPPEAPMTMPLPRSPAHAQYVPQQPPSPSRHPTAVTQNEINDATECAKFAIAALKIKDLNLARQRLEMALKFIR